MSRELGAAANSGSKIFANMPESTVLKKTGVDDVCESLVELTNRLLRALPEESPDEKAD